MGCQKLTYRSEAEILAHQRERSEAEILAYQRDSENSTSLKVVYNNLKMSEKGRIDCYRYGFNGKEMDNDVYGDGNVYDYGFRIYNPRLGRFLSVDPLSKSFPWYTPFQFAGNKPIAAIDLDGLEEYYVVKYTSGEHLLGITFLRINRALELEKEKIEHAKLVLDVEVANKKCNDEINKKENKKQKWFYEQQITQNNKDLAASEARINELSDNMSKVLIEEIDVANGGVSYFGMKTLELKSAEMMVNPDGYSQGKELSDEMGLKEQNILNIGAPAGDLMINSSASKAISEGAGYLNINIPQSMNINFATNEYQIPTNTQELDNLVWAMTVIPDLKIELTGHTDNEGTDEYNTVLSKNRAESSKAYLVSKGIDPDRITTAGKGASEPVQSNDTSEGRAANRRMTIKAKM